MRNKVRARVIGRELRDYKNMILDWEEYMDDTQAMNELREMSGKEVVRVIREVWEEVKSID